MNEIQPIEHQGERVLTTAQLAKVYGTEENNIKVNFSNNKDRFVEGRDYYRLESAQLKDFKNQVNDVDLVDPKASHLILWTRRGANRHCKLLGTDQAWQQFDILEETYFLVETKQNAQPHIASDTRTTVMLMNARTRQANLMVKMAKEWKDILCSQSQAILVGLAAEMLTGQPNLLPRPVVEKTYSAGDIAEEAKVSSNKVGRIANHHKLKTAQYGITVLDKSPYSAKQVPSFRYNERGRAKLLELLQSDVSKVN